MSLLTEYFITIRFVPLSNKYLDSVKYELTENNHNEQIILMHACNCSHMIFIRSYLGIFWVIINVHLMKRLKFLGLHTEFTMGKTLVHLMIFRKLTLYVSTSYIIIMVYTNENIHLHNANKLANSLDIYCSIYLL